MNNHLATYLYFTKIINEDINHIDKNNCQY